MWKWISAAGVAVLLTVCAMVRGIVYRRVLRRLDSAKEEICEEARKKGAFAPIIPKERIIEISRVPKWLAHWALNWESDKKKGRI